MKAGEHQNSVVRVKIDVSATAKLEVIGKKQLLLAGHFLFSIAVLNRILSNRK